MSALTDDAIAWNRMMDNSLLVASFALDDKWSAAAIACLFRSETASGGLDGCLDVCHEVSGSAPPAF